MDIILKIKDGTGKLTGESLCKSCSNGHIITTEKQQIVRCDWSTPQIRITEKVLNCSGYHNKTLPSVKEFEKIAWTIDPNRNGRTAGFKAPKKVMDE